MSSILRVFAVAFLAASGSANAHIDSAPHTHPHLAISNELLAALLLVAVFALIILSRRMASKRNAPARRHGKRS